MKKAYLYGAVALGLLFTGCSSDDPIREPGSASSKGERTLYVNLSIRTGVDGSESRTAVDDGRPAAGTTDFSDGVGESNVDVAYFVFYDNNGNVVGEPVDLQLQPNKWATGTTNTVEKYYKSTVGVTVANGQDNPTQVICYLNPQEVGSLKASLSTIQTNTRTTLNYQKSLDKDKPDELTTFFSMSNSVYYPTTASEAPQIAVQIAPNQIFATEKGADDALEDEDLTVNVYVERYASKLTFKSATPTAYQTVSRSATGGTDTPVTLDFVANKWILNAACEATYVVKSFREESSTGDILADNYAYQELNDVINKSVDGVTGNWSWNSINNHRSYWAMSPAYFTAEYPEVSGDVAGLLAKPTGSLKQKYYTYNELIGENGVGYEVKTDAGVTKYVHETTVGSKALASKNIVAALPSVILVGDYTLTVGTQTLTDTDFYTYGINNATDKKAVVYFGVKTGSINGESAVEGGESILRALINAATNLYKKVGDEYTNFDLKNEADLNKLTAVFDVVYPSDAVKGELKVPERYRTLQIKNGVTAAQLADIYVGTTDGYKTIIANNEEETPGATEITMLQANQELMTTVRFAYAYNAGAAYFNIPVKHFGWYRTTNTNKTADSMDWSNVRVGDFGVVRNHTYDITVNQILGLGTGIGGKNNPIVPPAEENTYYIAYSVNILKWAVVPPQTVNL